MTDIARITKHPSDRDVVLLRTPPEFNDRFGSFGPARYAPEHKCYVMHVDHVDALYRWAKRNQLHVVDERLVGSAHVVRTQPHECRNCGQPGARFNPPVVCPSCGQRWFGIEPPVRDDPITKYPCPSCGHKQPGRFPYCSSCGSPMDYRHQQPKRVLPRPEKRVHLDDPLPLGEQVKQMLDAGVLGEPQQQPREPVPRAPWQPAYVGERRVENVELPDDPEPTDAAETAPDLEQREPLGVMCDCPRARQPGDPGEAIGDIHEYDEWRCYPPGSRDDKPAPKAEPRPEPEQAQAEPDPEPDPEPEPPPEPEQPPILCNCPYTGVLGEHEHDPNLGCPSLDDTYDDEPEPGDEPDVEDPPTWGWPA